MTRSIISVLAGYLVSAVLTGITIAVLAKLFPASYNPENTGWVIANVLYGAVFAGVGGYVLATIAQEKANRNVLILAAIMAVLGILTFVASFGQTEYTGQPIWYYPLLLLLSIPAMIFGARLRSHPTV